ncbi:hypothetical protein [Listeria booriae]|uniref:hypothetical protein n=1 Tax=Listeria booriae TaxID=1552123 RepID=UPI001625A676|nr:hypothetical protein [Listeria booriae]MBC1233560.1 hypothetical protein [Listeria booriae]MBC1245880.1 hypothetical protein [Listeria booriae]
MKDTYTETCFTDLMKIIPYMKQTGDGEFSIEMLGDQWTETKDTVLRKSLLIFRKSKMYDYLIDTEDIVEPPHKFEMDGKWFDMSWSSIRRENPLSTIKALSEKGKKKLEQGNVTLEECAIDLKKKYKFHDTYLMVLLMVMSSYTIFSRDNVYVPSLIRMSGHEAKHGFDKKEYKAYYKSYFNQIMTEDNSYIAGGNRKLEGSLLGNEVRFPGLAKKNDAEDAISLLYDPNLEYLFEFLIYVYDESNLRDFYMYNKNIFVHFLMEQFKQAKDMTVTIEGLTVALDDAMLEEEVLTFFKETYSDSSGWAKYFDIKASMEASNYKMARKVLQAIGQLTRPEPLGVKMAKQNKEHLNRIVARLRRERAQNGVSVRVDGEELEIKVAKALKRLEKDLFQ